MDKFGAEKVPLIDFRAKLKMEKTASCVNDPEVSALEALKNHDRGLLCDLLSDETLKVDVNKTYPEEKSKTLLHLAIDEEDYESTRIILGAGANPNLINNILEIAPIHVAARKGNFHILQLLLSSAADVNAVTSDGKTALHILVKKCDVKNHQKILPCIQLLLKSQGIQIDKADRSIQTATPLFIAATETKNIDVIKLLVHHGADMNVRCRGKKIRDILVENFGPHVTKTISEESPSFEQQMLLDQGNSSTNRDTLVKLLNKAASLISDEVELEKNWKKFDEAVRLFSTSTDLVDAPTGDRSVIQMAADIGLPLHMKTILAFPGVNPNKCGSKHPPALILAARAGNYEVIRVLREHKEHNENRRDVITTSFAVTHTADGSTVLLAILRKPISDDLMPSDLPSSDREKYEMCLEVLLDQPSPSMKKEIRSIINKIDSKLGNTALHYATQMWSQSVVRWLLECGANIGIKNIYEEVPIAQILPETMEQFLDDHCMKTKGNVTNDNFEITLNFDFLVPPYDNDLIKGEKMTTKVDNWTEKDIEHQDKEAPSDGTVRDDDVPLPETEGLWYMSQSKKHQHLLKHPVIAAFLFLKWQKMAPAYNKNMLFYLAFVAFLTGYIFALFSGRAIRDDGILFDSCENKTESETNETDTATDVYVLWIILTAMLAILALREVVQFGVAPRRYFFSVENWLEVTLIVLTALLLFYGPIQCHISAKRQMSAIIIVLSWSELITMIGRHPKLTVYNIYVTMFYKVSRTFILFLAWYSCYIIAFGLGFYILLHEDNGEPAEDDKYIFFDHIGLALVKTFTMFVGELEFGNLPIKSSVGYLFLLAFIFLIVVVMMNLLNGLAVSDTGVIRQEAEIHSYKSQVGIVSYMESMMLGDPFNFLSNWPNYIWLKHVPTCSLIGGGKLYRIPSIRSFIHTLTGARYMMLFHQGGLKDNKITIYPNRESFRFSLLLPLCRCCRRREEELDLPESISESAKNLVVAKQKDESGEQMIQKLESRLKKVEQLLIQLVNGKASK